tara:strand:- start:74 stop:874 length:801 start_codon:yes stop_codon:yes gene_type:complete
MSATATATMSGTTKAIKVHCSDEEKEGELYKYYLTAYGVIMRRFICENVIPAQHELFRINRIKRCEEDDTVDVKHKQEMIKYFKNYQFSIRRLNHLDFDDSECPIVRKMGVWCDEFVFDNSVIIKKDLALNFVPRENGELTVNANVKKIKDFCLTYIQGEMEGKYKPMGGYIADYIHKHEDICLTKMEESKERFAALFEHKDVVEEKVAPKSKSQLKKEKAREANKRREQEKKDKQKRQEKEAKYLEQKRKEAEKKRIAVCRAKRK